MVLEICADSFVLDFNFDASGMEYFRVPNTGQLKNLRCLDNTCAQHHLSGGRNSVSLAIDDELCPGGGVSVKRNLRYMCSTKNFQILSTKIWSDVSSGSITSLDWVISSVNGTKRGITSLIS